MTVSLSNGMVVSLTSEQLRRKAGKGEFSVEVRTKGIIEALRWNVMITTVSYVESME